MSVAAIGVVLYMSVAAIGVGVVQDSASHQGSFELAVQVRGMARQIRTVEENSESLLKVSAGLLKMVQPGTGGWENSCCMMR